MSQKSKTCPRCKVNKEAGFFHKNKRDGLAPYCKACSLDYKRKGAKTKREILSAVYPADGIKRCSKCKECKAFDQFNRKGDGRLRSSCKQCQSATFVAWSKRQGKSKASGLSRLEMARIAKVERWDITDTHRTCSVCSERKTLDQFKRNRAYCMSCRNEKEAKLYSLDKEGAARKRAEYRANNQDKCREWARAGTQKRNAIKRGTTATLTPSEWEQILERYGRKCLCCGSTENLSMDHVMPLSKGGAHTADNIQPLCVTCNCKKHAKHIDYRSAA